MTDWYMTVCDVCRLVWGDMTPRKCFYCGFCDAWICEGHRDDWPARTHAKVLRMLEKKNRGSLFA